jgi:hypothetical protein
MQPYVAAYNSFSILGPTTAILCQYPEVPFNIHEYHSPLGRMEMLTTVLSWGKLYFTLRVIGFPQDMRSPQ